MFRVDYLDLAAGEPERVLRWMVACKGTEGSVLGMIELDAAAR